MIAGLSVIWSGTAWAAIRLVGLWSDQLRGADGLVAAGGSTTGVFFGFSVPA